MELFHSILAPFLERLETVETGSRSTVLKNFILVLLNLLISLITLSALTLWTKTMEVLKLFLLHSILLRRL